MGKDFGKTFRIEELEGGKCRRVVNNIFIEISCQLCMSFFGVFLRLFWLNCGYAPINVKTAGGGGRQGMGWGFDIFQKVAVKFPVHGQIIPVKCNQISRPRAAHCCHISQGWIKISLNKTFFIERKLISEQMILKSKCVKYWSPDIWIWHSRDC